MNKKDLLKLIESEGDDKFWVYTAQNGIKIPCSIHRSSILILCGYVHIDRDNKLWGLSYDDVHKYDIDVHGGLTYNGYDDNIWIFGFDCGHHGDLIPYYIINDDLYKIIDITGTYRDMNYVISEVEQLAEQLSKYSLSELRIKKIDNLIN
jgi:hypothetical protein